MTVGYVCDTTEAPAMAHVIVRAENATLYREPKQSSEQQTKVCDAPCEVDLPICDVYSIGGHGLETTTFVLHAKPGETIALDVDRTAETGKMIGLGTVGLGIIGMGVSVYILYFGALASIGTRGDGGDHVLNAGEVGFTVSAAVATAGGVVYLLTRRPTLSQEKLTTVTPPRDAFVRTPTWRHVDMGSATPHFPVQFTFAF